MVSRVAPVALIVCGRVLTVARVEIAWLMSEKNAILAVSVSAVRRLARAVFVMMRVRVVGVVS
jgi:hypothetical protein